MLCMMFKILYDDYNVDAFMIMRCDACFMMQDLMLFYGWYVDMIIFVFYILWCTWCMDAQLMSLWMYDARGTNDIMMQNARDG